MHLNIFLIVVISCYQVCGQSDGRHLNLPQIQTEHVQLTSEDNTKYSFSLTLPNSERAETIYFEPSSAEVSVKGTTNTYYPDDMVNLIVDYVADKNGCRVSYKITKDLPDSELSFETRLSASDLKSLVG